MTKTEQSIINAVTDYYGMEIPWVRSERSGLWRVSVEDVTVQISEDDGVVYVNVFTGGRAMLNTGEVRFTHMPAALVAHVIGFHLDAALATV